MSDLHFANPQFGYAVWAWLVFVGILVLFERRGSASLDRLVGSALQSQLVDQPARWRRWLRVGLIGFAGLCMIVALMRPQWGMRHVATPRVGAEIMIAIDVSRSMLADDAKPTRLERAKADVADLLAYLDDDHVGLIAFAGRATVLSPMTPDKSFLRLALDGLGPHSVTRGGTRLAEPILRAVAGMGEAGPAQRALILITDGEDHDSFALDAAKVAAEAGIKIIAVGFGDEAGSQIYVTDRRSGARTLLRDGDGSPVVSRLDGDALREIALATDGAYVPAGTGVLDLASIYDAHIARLTRSQLDSRGKIIRDEIYQWFVLLALIALVAAVGVAGGPARGAQGRSVSSARAAAALALLLGVSVLAAPIASAQPLPEELADVLDADAAELETPAPDDGDAQSSTRETARERYNRGTALLEAGDPTAAAALLRDARRDATDDVALRHAATYNLGVAAVAHAEAVEAENPTQALDSLYEAADWFRDATRQAAEGEDEDARHNLEVALRKALVLADFLAKQNEETIEAELDALVAKQRERAAASASLLEAVARGSELDTAEELRPAFAAEATAQRTLTADANALGERIARERDAIAAMTEEERTPQDAMRGAQLDAALQFLDSGIERMGQARRQLRQRRAERAYRRNAAALAELKRARDQLRDPVEQIGVLLEEVASLMRSSAALGAAAGGAALPGAAAPVVLPAFLSQESASEEASSVSLRVDELAQRLELGLERAAASAAEGAPAGASADDPETKALLAAVGEAAPFVRRAADSLSAAVASLEAAAYSEALDAERSSAEALAAARERFFDLKQLIEASYADEQRIAALATSEEPEVREHRDEYVDLLAELQRGNVERGARLGAKLDDAIAEVAEELATAPEDDSAPADPNAASPEQLEQQNQRLTLARGLLDQALAAMDEANRALVDGSQSDAVDWPVVGESAKRAEQHLEAMRTLFFSIVEHVRELARKQVDLSDRTSETVALAAADPEAAEPPEPSAAGETAANGDDAPEPPGAGAADGAEADATDTEAPQAATPDAAATAAPRGPETLARTAALGPEQTLLADRAGLIGDALAKQAEAAANPETTDGGAAAAPPQGAAPGAAQGATGDPEAAGRLRLAAEHVVAAQLEMQAAGAGLVDAAAPLAAVPARQATALEELRKALEALEPPQDPNEQQQQEQQEQDEQQQEQRDEQPEPSENAEPEREQDPAQLLQGVRDREAERRRDRERRREAARNQPVDKDW